MIVSFSWLLSVKSLEMSHVENNGVSKRKINFRKIALKVYGNRIKFEEGRFSLYYGFIKNKWNLIYFNLNTGLYFSLNNYLKYFLGS